MSELEALKSLGAFPVVQAAVALIVLLAGVWMMFRGSQDKKPPTNGTPSWALYGPVHDAMRAMHEMTEQSREGNRTLLRIEDEVKEIRKEQREGTMLLEAIQNNQVMRGDIQVPPPPPRRKSSI